MVSNIDKIIEAAVENGTTRADLIKALQYYANTMELLILHLALGEDEKTFSRTILMTFLKCGWTSLESMECPTTFTSCAQGIFLISLKKMIASFYTASRDGRLRTTQFRYTCIKILSKVVREVGRKRERNPTSILLFATLCEIYCGKKDMEINFS
jgi:hypothetical protein